ncbi:DUF2243 domain-containing protein, partial [Ancylothrix sp. C2]|uniref:DUF2243 domain-containing protein n=1 Tax=Ancylothrix sp. D3o TaxID=2953691 RepID=UPI0021BA5C6C
SCTLTTFLVGKSLHCLLFSLIQQALINHQLLGIHHVKEGPNYLAWDIGFLVVNLLIIGGGWLILKKSQQPKIGI